VVEEERLAETRHYPSVDINATLSHLAVDGPDGTTVSLLVKDFLLCGGGRPADDGVHARMTGRAHLVRASLTSGRKLRCLLDLIHTPGSTTRKHF
jgi:hypothetical protein